MSEESFNIDCSDDELREVQTSWEPSPEKIEKLYNIIERGEIPELQWKSPGYRMPTPERKEQNEENKTVEIENKSDFDFMDEMGTPKLKIRNKGEETLKGSAKKKTTSLDGVLSNMRRHNLLPAKNS
ncbi:PAXIP1-associated glutamate-rich protein 1 [Coccinella septempunctata]|uniref:PAXIP1-associated glutamate-rich protein 1 n=1 Tax=Coccinella septempunctata TaxID=41139 RepID=UPI001D08FBAA|nr:PAXIP1-associated glutamate-rich protein 1 [Coccinella septempunctata]